MPRVTGVRYNSAGTSVLCEHCDKEIPRGDDFAVQLNCPEEGIHDWIGPYCRTCMPLLKVCSCCNKAYFGDDITYSGDGRWYCGHCVDSHQACGCCGTLSESVVTHRGRSYCKKCFDSKFFECDCCDKVKGKDNYLKLSGKLQAAQYPSLFKVDDGLVCDLCMKGMQRKLKPAKVYECKRCLEIHAGEGNDYCRDCYEKMDPCSNCGEKDHRSKSPILDGTHAVLCSKCNSKLHKCKGCGGGTLSPVEEVDIFGNKVRLCKACSGSQCSKCLKFSDLVDGVCNACSGVIGSTCTGCGVETMHGGRGHCRACDSGRAEVLNYSYKPSPLIFHYNEGDVKARDCMFLGFELELTVDSSMASKNEVLTGIYGGGKYSELLLDAKSDGSIGGNGGFELVSYPMTLGYFDTIDWSHLFTGLQDHKSCGMHVHISRDAIKSKLHEYKLINFVYENEVFIDEIAGRSYTSYNSKTNAKHTALALGNASSSRSSRVNLNNTNTIELRYFSSTTSLYLFKARIQQVHSMVKYLEFAGMVEIKKGTDGYFKYIAKNKCVYPELFKFINSASRSWNTEAEVEVVVGERRDIEPTMHFDFSDLIWSV